MIYIYIYIIYMLALAPSIKWMGLCGSHILLASIAMWIPFSMSSHKFDFKSRHKFVHIKFSPELSNTTLGSQIKPWALKSLPGLSVHSPGCQIVPWVLKAINRLSPRCLGSRLTFRARNHSSGFQIPSWASNHFPGSQIITWALKSLPGLSN